jgi:rRNA maturation RNase YbeY
MASLDIKNLARRRLTTPRSAFSEVAASVLPEWDISLVFVGTTKALALNKKLRKKNYAPNVLSYIVGDKSAEIIICPTVAVKQSPDFQLSASSFLLLLFIHAALHIKGWAHGANMEICERRLLARFAKSDVRDYFNEKTHSNRNRHRHIPGKDGRR